MVFGALSTDHLEIIKGHEFIKGSSSTQRGGGVSRAWVGGLLDEGPLWRRGMAVRRGAWMVGWGGDCSIFAGV